MVRYGITAVIVLIFVAACSTAPVPDLAGEVVVATTAPTTAADAALPEATAAPENPSPAPVETPDAAGAVPADPASLEIALVPVVDGLSQPIGITAAGDGSGRLFILEKVGRVRVVKDGVLLEEPFLDLTDRVNSASYEQGLLGLAFHPDYAANGYFFVHYTGSRGEGVIARFAVTGDPDMADPASEENILTIAQPAPNHNGGHIAFGPDGYLYIGLGDGGAAGDRFGNGQNLQTLLGSMLRIDVDELPYTIPPDNPFVGDAAALDEIWAYGLRNPWGFSFDRLTGDLYIGDVGQNLYEEINFQPASSFGGENYGWPITEGFHCYDAVSCDTTGLVMPVAEYDHSRGCSVTGGLVYRGGQFPEMDGVYFFGDFCSGIVWGLARGASGIWQVAVLARSGLQISAFGADENGEIYVLDMQGGGVYQLVSAAN